MQSCTFQRVALIFIQGDKFTVFFPAERTATRHLKVNVGTVSSVVHKQNSILLDALLASQVLSTDKRVPGRVPFLHVAANSRKAGGLPGPAGLNLTQAFSASAAG